MVSGTFWIMLKISAMVVLSVPVSILKAVVNRKYPRIPAFLYFR